MIQTALREIKRGTAEIIDEARLETLLKNFFEKGETYTVKAGFDPTAPDLAFGTYRFAPKTGNISKIRRTYPVFDR
jgi:tyrosyl-tRNA synthetase